MNFPEFSVKATDWDMGSGESPGFLGINPRHGTLDVTEHVYGSGGLIAS